MKIIKKLLELEFIRYCFAGGTAFLVDFGSLFVLKEYILPQNPYKLYIAVTLAFVAGFAANYILSFLLVFNNEDQREKSKKSFTVAGFLLVGVLGLALTNFGMWLGCAILLFNYLIVKIFVTAAVFVWNYLGRKLMLNIVQ